MKENDHQSEFENKEQQVYSMIHELHGKFLEVAPKYSRGQWNPIEAFKSREGSCMAELLYVASGLVAKGVLDEKDIAIGFSKKHGSTELTGYVGGVQKKAAHTSAYFIIGNGVTLAADFRAHRADETPQIEKINSLSEEADELNDYYIGSFGEAMHKYATDLNDVPVSIGALIAMHYGQMDSIDTTEITDAVRFDEDF